MDAMSVPNTEDEACRVEEPPLQRERRLRLPLQGLRRIPPQSAVRRWRWGSVIHPSSTTPHLQQAFNVASNEIRRRNDDAQAVLK